MDRYYKLQILVPQYKETDELVKPLLDSLAIQQGVSMDDFSVIIGNDGSDVYLSDRLLKSYPYLIAYHHFAHGGVSATRNRLLELVSGEYVMFCDADDMFYSALGLFLLFKEMQEGYDVITSEFVAEERISETGEADFGVYDHDGIFVHGKAFLKEYLDDYQIRFNEDLTICEDCNFVSKALSLTSPNMISYISKSFYLWKWHDGSVSRRGFPFVFNTYMQMIESNRDLLETLMDRGVVHAVRNYVIQMVINFYYMPQDPNWVGRQDSPEFKAVLAKFGEWARVYGPIWDKSNITQKMEILDGLYSANFKAKPRNELHLIDRWFRTVQTK